MTAPNLSTFDVVIFDLDDTLYAEKSYVTSGYSEICRYLQCLYDTDFSTALQRNQGQANVLKAALAEVGLGEYLLPQLVQIYRYHQPSITLFPQVATILAALKHHNIPIYLITDGRSLTQRLKIKALGIESYFKGIYISEEQGHEKPALHSFQAISDKEPNKRLVYIGDNPKKDFIAPKQLGWSTIGVKHLETRVHPWQVIEEPDYWLASIDMLTV